MSVAEGNVGVALGLVTGAGAATAVGSAVVFFPSLVKLASKRVLAGSLGLSAGVMTYVSFVEIFVKSVEGFGDYLDDPDLGYIYATLSFFGGVVAMLVSNVEASVRAAAAENVNVGSTRKVAEAASAADEVVAEAASTAATARSWPTLRPRRTMSCRRLRPRQMRSWLRAEAASTVDEVVAEAASTVNENLAEVATTAEEAVAEVAFCVNSLRGSRWIFLQCCHCAHFLLFFAKNVFILYCRWKMSRSF